jgi:hypothetical protein
MKLNNFFKTAGPGRFILAGLLLTATAVPTLTPTALNMTDITLQISDVPGIHADAAWSTAAYDPIRDQYLVVWEQEDAAANGVTDEIFGQFMAGDGVKIGTTFQISYSDSSGGEIGAGHPDVVYNASAQEYFVVWETDVFTRDQFKIRGAQVMPGSAVADSVIEILPFGDDAREPAVACDSLMGRYTVAWTNTDADADTISTIGISQVEFPAGVISRHRITNPPTSGFAPDICFNTTQDVYLMVWVSDQSMAAFTHEIFAYFLDQNGSIVFADRISDMSNAGADRDAFDPAVCFNHDNDQFLIVWTGDGDTLSNDEYETFGQIQAGFGWSEVNDFQISAAGGGDPDRDSHRPSAVYSSDQNAYLVFAESDGLSPADEVYEICARRLSNLGEIISPYLAVSAMSATWPDGDARLAASVYNPVRQEFLVTWNGNNNVAMDNNEEVFGNLSGLEPLPVFFTNIRAAALESGEVEITWISSTDEPVQGFQVYRRTGEGVMEVPLLHNLLDPDLRRYTDTTVRPGLSYSYSVGAKTQSGREFRSSWAAIQLIPRRFNLTQNFPNPFNPSTTISYDLPDVARVSLVVYDVTGREVTRLVDQKKPAGHYEVQWDGSNAQGDPAASGVYLYRLTAKSAGGKHFSKIRKLVLAR